MPREWLALCLLMNGCALCTRTTRPAHASPEEAAQVRFPLDVPADTRTVVSGAMVTAMQLGLEDFLPLEATPHKGATPEEVCLYRRESYEVAASPSAQEGVFFVSVSLRPGVCEAHDPILDMGAAYAVDVLGRRILAVRR